MAISNISGPQSTTPVYNPMVWVFDSTNKNIIGFRYVFTISDSLGNELVKQRIAPEPQFGYGYSDISEIINNQLEHHIDLNATYTQQLTNNFEYKLRVDEEYLYSWDFIGVTWSAGDSYFTLLGTTPSIWNLNNQVEISVSIGDTWVSGNHIVLDSPGNNTRILGEYGGTGTASGTVYWTNRSRTLNIGATYSGYNGFIGAIDMIDFFDYNENNILIDGASTTRELLTNLPDNFYMTETQDAWMTMYRDLSTTTGISVRFVNDGGDIFTGLAWSSGGTVSTTSFEVSPNRTGLILVSGTGSLVKPTTEYYDFFLVAGGTSTQLTKKYRVYIDRRCKIEDYEILFVDRMGSWLSYAFQLRSKETGSVDRKSYNKTFGSIDVVNGWYFDKKDGGQSIYSLTFDKELELNTNWMTDEMSVYFEELLTSPVTYIKDADGFYKLCTVQDNGFETQRQKNKNLIKKSVKVKFAVKNRTNI